MSDTEPLALDCGRTLDEISDYLAHDRIPYDAHIETCPECLEAICALQNVAKLSQDLLAQEARALPAPPETWMRDLMGIIRSELHAGRSVPISHPDPRVRLTVTEGAIRSLLRRVGDEVDGVVIGKCDIDGDIEIPGAPVTVRLTASVAWGVGVPAAIARLRPAVYEALAQHTELNVVAVDLLIADMHVLPGKEDPS